MRDRISGESLKKVESGEIYLFRSTHALRAPDARFSSFGEFAFGLFDSRFEVGGQIKLVFDNILQPLVHLAPFLEGLLRE